MKLQTQIPLKSQPNSIKYESDVFLMGSCFVENIGEKLHFYKFKAEVNPFGIIFHPQAIETLLQRVVSEKAYTEKDIFFWNERWHCFEVHSNLSNVSKEEILKNLNETLENTKRCVINSSHLIFTLGTAWGYELKETGHWVANCHKVPQKAFQKKIASVPSIEKSINQVLELTKKLNPDATVIFTVSPVRHIKDGFVENQRSKAHLITAVQNVLEKEQNAHYFPSYELMMDELRDYRFYAEDMIHPNKTAVTYIWEKFEEVWISSTTEETMKTVEQVQQGMAHRPFNAESNDYKKFQEKLQQKITYLSEKHPHIKF